MALFKDRTDAGQQLAKRLTIYARRSDVIVLALPRGGVPVAAEVAEVLQAPLDVWLVRKLGVPGRRELAMGAIASGGVRVLNEEIIEALNITDEMIDVIATEEQRELERREAAYRDDRPPLDLRDWVVILIDDGLATGASMHAAVVALRAQQPKRIVVAAPTAAPETCAAFEQEVDEVVCAFTPQPFRGVGAWYEEFSQTTDEEVRQLLKQIRKQEVET